MGGGVGWERGERMRGRGLEAGVEVEGKGDRGRERSMSRRSLCVLEMRDSRAGSMMSKVMEMESVESVSGVRARGPRWWRLRTDVWVDGSQSHVFCWVVCGVLGVVILASRSRWPGRDQSI